MDEFHLNSLTIFDICGSPRTGFVYVYLEARCGSRYSIGFLSALIVIRIKLFAIVPCCITAVASDRAKQASS